MIARRIGVSALARELDLDPLVVIEVARMLGIAARSRTRSPGIGLTVSETDAAVITEEWQKQLTSNHLLQCLAISERDRRNRLSVELSEVKDRLTRHFQGPLVASSRKKHFHRWSCKWATSFGGSPAQITFLSHEAAVQAGYRPCKTCRA